MTDPKHQPTGIDLQDSRSRFAVSWEDGSTTAVSYRAMRLACRCAVCVDEMTGKPLLDPQTVPADVGVQGCHQVGLYGVQIRWTDGHGTGIYSWERVRELSGE